MFICFGNILDVLYILTLDKHELYNSELDNNSHVKSLKRKFPSTSDAYLWHLLGHINSNRIQRLIKDGLFEPMDFDGFPICESCLEGKITKRPFNVKGKRALELLDLVHTDVYGPMSIHAKIHLFELLIDYLRSNLYRRSLTNRCAHLYAVFCNKFY